MTGPRRWNGKESVESWHENRWQRPLGATPTTHIFKLPLGRVGNMQADLSTSIENEWLCTQIVRAYGLPTASCEMARFHEQRVLIVERFDRRLSRDQRWWIRLPQEDLCQATGTPAGHKYEADGGPGMADILSLLLGARDARTDRRTFFQAQLLYGMLAATDGHAKNFSVFIEARGRFALTPLYDILSAYPVLGHGPNEIAPEKVRMAMSVRGHHRHYHWQRILRRHWETTALACNLGAEIEPLLGELVERTPAVIAEVSARIPPGFPAAVGDRILGGLQAAASRLGGLV